MPKKGVKKKEVVVKPVSIVEKFEQLLKKVQVVKILEQIKDKTGKVLKTKVKLVIPVSLTVRSMSKGKFLMNILTNKLWSARYVIQFKSYYTLVEITTEGKLRFLKNYRPLRLPLWLEKLKPEYAVPEIPVIFDNSKVKVYQSAAEKSAAK